MRRVKVGDVFRFAVEDKFGYGQIVAKPNGQVPYIAIFERLSETEIDDLEKIAHGPLALLANSFDSRIFSGDWVIIGNIKPDLSRIPFPSYKTSMGTIENIYVVSHDGKRERKATAEEAQKLDYRSSVAPIRLEDALRALHGFAKWESDYDRLTYAHVCEQAQIASI